MTYPARATRAFQYGLGIFALTALIGLTNATKIIGAASFIAVLIFIGTSAGSSTFAHPVAFTAPIMGLSALLAIVTYEMRLMAAQATMRAPAPA